MLRVSAIAEAAGVPTSSLCCEGFLGQAKTTSVGLGYPNLSLATVPGHVDVQTVEELRANVLGTTVDHVIPKSKGGSGKISNLVTACLRCNNEKADGPHPVPAQPRRSPSAAACRPLSAD